MGKYNPYARREETKKAPIIHPIWRGVGFAMMILIPIISYLGTLVILQENGKRGWFPIPADLISPIVEPLFIIKILMTVVLMMVLYSIFMLITFLINRLLAPPRYGPYDVPSQSYSGKRYKR